MPQPLHCPLTTFLAEKPYLVIDGALATELEARGCDLNDALWSAKTLIEQPELIRQVHVDYFNAGADIAITASYQATPLGLAARGLGEEEAVGLIGKSVVLAREARDEVLQQEQDAGRERRRLLVAGSVGPYGAYLADGSEYRGDYSLPREEMKDFHRLRIKALLDAGVDVLACETMPSFQEVEALLSLLEEEFPQATAWLSFTLKDEAHLPDGSALDVICKLMRQSRQVSAVGVNCIRQELVAGALRNLAASGKPLLAYPNSGEVWDAKTKTWSGVGTDGASLHELVCQWYAAGAKLIGGCCKTGPKDIDIIRKTLSRSS